MKTPEGVIFRHGVKYMMVNKSPWREMSQCTKCQYYSENFPAVCPECGHRVRTTQVGRYHTYHARPTCKQAFVNFFMKSNFQIQPLIFQVEWLVPENNA